jgi:hypothetical protein
MHGDGWHFSEGRGGAGKRDGTRSEEGERGIRGTGEMERVGKG